MKYGAVVTIRLNPEDIMGVVDLVSRSQLPTQGMSLAVMVRMVLSSFLERARQSGVIERREGFEYLDMVKDIKGQKHAAKIAVTDMIEKIEAERIKIDQPASFISVQPAPTRAEVVATPIEMKKGRVLRQMVEIQEKMEVDSGNTDVEYLRLLEDAYAQLDSGTDVVLTWMR